jgi:hypothetical protein
MSRDFTLQGKVVGFRRPFLLYGRPQHRRQVAFQFDSELAVNGRHDDGVDVTKPTFFAISAEGALKMVFRGYLQELCAPGEIERRVDAMEAKALQQRRDDGLPDMFSKDKQWARRLLRDSLVNHRAHFDRIRREFFFIDQVPENDQRFDVKFEDCQPSPDGPVQT